MDIFGVLSFVGGLAMFLYGMSAMGDGLTKLSGGKLEYLLEKLTSKRIMAVLLGAGVTAVIQSSSATTVMVVGFVNSGIMKLNQAVGIIMGANIGTTITSWILSLTGIQGDNVFIKMLNPSSFSPILAIIGVFMLMLAMVAITIVLPLLSLKMFTIKLLKHNESECSFCWRYITRQHPLLLRMHWLENMKSFL